MAHLFILKAMWWSDYNAGPSLESLWTLLGDCLLTSPHGILTEVKLESRPLHLRLLELREKEDILQKQL